MALRVWLPLTGTLENKGISVIEFNQTGSPTVNAEGKIGSCYYFDGNSYFISKTNTYLTNMTECSFACWIKNTYTGSSYMRVFGVGTHKRAHLDITNTGKLRFFVSKNGTNNTYWGPIGTTDLRDSTWHHICGTFNNKECKVYVDGICEATVATNDLPTITGGQFEIGHIQDGIKMTGYLNDLRMYDHCLSPLEVKEISQGLILHYKLDGFSGGAGENLATNTTFPASAVAGYKNGKAVEYNHSDWTSGGRFFAPYTSSQLTFTEIEANQPYTISAWVYIYDDVALSNPGSTSIFYRIYKTGDSPTYSYDIAVTLSGVTERNKWVRISNTFTSPATYTYDQAQGRFNIGGYNGHFLVSLPKVEKGSAATSWTPTLSEMGIDTTKIVDSSGYGNDGIQNNIAIAHDENGRYLLSSSFNGSNSYIKVKDNNWLQQGMEAITISLWAKNSSWAANTHFFSCTETGGFNTETGNSGYLRFPLHVYTAADKSSVAYKYDSKEIQLSALSTTDWNMITWVYDSTGTKTYVNGVLHHTYTNTSYGIHFNANARLFLGCEASTANPTTPYYNGQMSDFRLYCTALSAEDIATLYHTPAQIDSLNNAHMFEAIEDDNIKIEKNGVFRNKWSEGLELKKLSDGSIWAKLYYYDYDEESVAWTPKDAKWCNKKGKYSCLGDLEKFIPKSGWYEFWYTEDRTGTKYIRWKQSYNPLSRITASTSGTSSEYQFISGTTSNNFYGLTRYNSNDSSYCYLRGYPSWWGAIAPYQTSYDVFPGLWGTSSNNHYQELWINITENENISRLTANSQSLYIIEK